MQLKPPLVTIITITRNSERTISQTMASVLNQDYKNIEYLIIDGMSKDRTLEIAKSFADSRMRIISEPDNGISDAMNKGIRLASGEIIGIIHSDDYYLPHAIAAAVSAILATGAVWAYGQIEYIDSYNQSLYISGQPFNLNKLKRFMMIPHPSVFMKRQVYEDLGPFKAEFKLAMDYELCLRISLKYQPTFIPSVMAKMRLGGASSASLASEFRVADEVLLIKQQLLGKSLPAFLYCVWTKAKATIRRTILRCPYICLLVPKIRKWVNPNFVRTTD